MNERKMLGGGGYLENRYKYFSPNKKKNESKRRKN